MEASKKAKQLMKYFSEVGDILFTEEEQIKLSIAYIFQLINDVQLIDDDYKIDYKHEWFKYLSYWREVLMYVTSKK